MLAIVMTIFYMILAWFGAKMNLYIAPNVTYLARGITLMFAAAIYFYKSYYSNK